MKTKTKRVLQLQRRQVTGLPDIMNSRSHVHEDMLLGTNEFHILTIDSDYSTIFEVDMCSAVFNIAAVAIFTKTRRVLL